MAIPHRRHQSHRTPFAFLASCMIMRNPSLILLIHIPAPRMLQIPRQHQIGDIASFIPLVQRKPRHALVQAREVPQRDGREVAPAQRYRRDVPAAHDPPPDHVEAVLVVHAVVFDLCGGEVWEVVFREDVY
jgi:hypothetical protein